MTSKEWIKEQLSYTDDHWTTTDRIMLNKILKDLEHLEQNVKDTHDTLQEVITDLDKELDIFKLAFYALWKCCNSNDISSDIDSDFYIEFKCGYESVCIPVTEQEIESIKKATELLDVDVKEVLE